MHLLEIWLGSRMEMGDGDAVAVPVDMALALALAGVPGVRLKCQFDIINHAIS